MINIVFDGPPGPRGPRLIGIHDDDGRSFSAGPDGPPLVEIEDDSGHSVTIGQWGRSRRWVLGVADPVSAQHVKPAGDWTTYAADLNRRSPDNATM